MTKEIEQFNEEMEGGSTYEIDDGMTPNNGDKNADEHPTTETVVPAKKTRATGRKSAATAADDGSEKKTPPKRKPRGKSANVANSGAAEAVNEPADGREWGDEGEAAPSPKKRRAPAKKTDDGTSPAKPARRTNQRKKTAFATKEIETVSAITTETPAAIAVVTETEVSSVAESAVAESAVAESAAAESAVVEPAAASDESLASDDPKKAEEKNGKTVGWSQVDKDLVADNLDITLSKEAIAQVANNGKSIGAVRIYVKRLSQRLRAEAKK